MTDIHAGAIPTARNLADPSTFSVDDVFWGYHIRSGLRPAFAVVLGQVLSFFLGACFATAALGILLLPTVFFDGDFTAMRIGSAALFGAASAYLLWFASRGTQTAVEVDISFSEMRQVIHNRAGGPTTVAALPFDAISGIYIEKPDGAALSSLVLRHTLATQTLVVAQGTEAQLIPLQARLAQDILTRA